MVLTVRRHQMLNLGSMTLVHLPQFLSWAKEEFRAKELGYKRKFLQKATEVEEVSRGRRMALGA